MDISLQNLEQLVQSLPIKERLHIACVALGLPTVFSHNGEIVLHTGLESCNGCVVAVGKKKSKEELEEEERLEKEKAEQEIENSKKETNLLPENDSDFVKFENGNDFDEDDNDEDDNDDSDLEDEDEFEYEEEEEFEDDDEEELED